MDPKYMKSRRKAIHYPIQHLYVVTDNFCDKYLKLHSGDVVTVLDNSHHIFWVVRKDGCIGKVNSIILRPIDKGGLTANYINSKRQERNYSAQHHIESKLGPMPHTFDIIGFKAFEHANKMVTVYFIQVKATSPHVNPLVTSESDECWIVAKTQKCFMKLQQSLERYVGVGGVPAVPDISNSRPPGWTIERWLEYRFNALKDFMSGLRDPRRGLCLPISNAPTTGFSRDDMYMHGAHSAGVNLAGDVSYPTHSARSSSADNMEFSFEGMFGGSDMGDFVGGGMGIDVGDKGFSGGNTQTTTLLDALAPLNFFLRTDKVKIDVSPTTSQHNVSTPILCNATDPDTNSENVNENLGPSDSCEESTSAKPAWSVVVNGSVVEPFPPTPLLEADYLYRRGETTEPRVCPVFPDIQVEEDKEPSDDEIADAVKRGEFSVSPFTPIGSLLRIWSVTSADNTEDHHPGEVQSAYSGFDTEAASQETLDEETDSDEDREDDSAYGFFEQRQRCSMYPVRAARASVTALGSDGSIHARLSQIAEKPRKRLHWNLATNSPKSSSEKEGDPGDSVRASIDASMTRIKDALSSISDILKDKREARTGLNAFAQFSLASLVAAIRKGSADNSASNLENSMSMSGSMSRPNSSRISSFYDTGSDAILGLNDKINALSQAWERRRMEEKQREQDAREGNNRPSAAPQSDEAKIQHCEYVSTADELSKPFPSQLAGYEALSASALARWLAVRARSRLSRKSDRVVRMERMQKLDASFQKIRITTEQMISIMDVIDQEEEKQHALFILGTRLYDVVESDHYELWESLELNAELERRAKHVVKALEAEARAEHHCKCILDLKEQCVKHRKHAKTIMAKIPKGFGTSRWKDDFTLSPSKAKITELKQDVTTIRKLVAECRVIVEEGAGHVTGAAQEQTLAAKNTLELKKLVGKSESVSKMRGVLSAGKPEYLVHTKLKTAMTVAERARTLSAQAVDETSAAYSYIKRSLAELEDTQTLSMEFAIYLQRKLLTSASDGSIMSDDGDVITILDQCGNDFHDPLLGVGDGGGKSSGWRREMKEIFADNYLKFLKAAGVDGEGGNTLDEEDSVATNLARMCLLISRMPLLRDTHTAIEEWNRREDEMNNSQDGDAEEDYEEEEDGDGISEAKSVSPPPPVTRPAPMVTQKSSRRNLMLLGD